MFFYEILRPSLLILLVLSALLFAARIIMAEIVERQQKGYIEYKPLGWYSQQEVHKATSPQTRKFMLRSNTFSTALWCILALVAILAVFNQQNI